MKTLVVAEKPSVARDIAKALGGLKKQGDHFERDDLIVTSARGHLAGLEVQEAVAGATLPIIPAEFGVAPIDDDCAKRIEMIAGLAKKAAVTRIVNACDAGREGELIFWYVLQCIGVEKPCYRMWMQSMTDGAIRQAFDGMFPAADKAGLLAAARSRAEADWLVGINGSRAFTQLVRMATGQRISVTVGRVQTPTLALIAHRELHIRNFRPQDYYEIHATFGVGAGQYVGRWMRQRLDETDDSKHRIAEPDYAQAIILDCREHAAAGGKISVREESKPSNRAPGKLFDLTTLQREANTRFGFTAKQTLDLAQSLYEKHKATSYPRTDACHLPDDYPDKVRGILCDLQKQAAYASLATSVIDNDWVATNGAKTFDSSKVSDHFAIIPTGQVPNELSEAEQKIYDLVVRRFLAVFYPAARYLLTTRVTGIGANAFLSTGRVLEFPGWLAVFGQGASEGDDAAPDLCQLTADEAVELVDIEAKAKQTTPPKRFTEATLLTAMEHASGSIDDDADAREAMSEKGLGTPATRAATIEGLVEKGYVERAGKQMAPTERGLQLIHQLERLDLGQLTSARLTGEWEHRLGLVEKDQLSRAGFMTGIGEFTRHLVTRLDEAKHQLKPDHPTHPCPDCGFPLLKAQSKFNGAHYWECSNYPACKTKCEDAGGKPGRKKEKPVASTEHLCPECGAGLIFRRGIGKKGAWKMWSCSGFPDCKAAFNDAGGKPVFQEG